MTTTDVLIINSYAGSLTIAASQLGLKIRGSYEDAGFGLRTQRLNFPDLHYVEKLPWPEQDLSDTIVIAHPPCAAFSGLNTSNATTARNLGKTYLGKEADSFECHRRVMEYSLSQNCKYLAIESVVGAFEGASQVHDEYARKYGYNVYRILQNAVTFGVPQWRERFWVVFSKYDCIELYYKPEIVPLGSIMIPSGTLDPIDAPVFKKLLEAGINKEKFFEMMNGERIGTLFTVARDFFEIDDPGEGYSEIRKKLNLFGFFDSSLPRMLNPELWATVLLHHSSFYIPGRPFYVEEYCAVMGFPSSYKWHECDRKEFRKYLSKGVCPPVARWLLDNLAGNKRAVANNLMEPGDVLDLRVKKKDVEKILRRIA